MNISYDIKDSDYIKYDKNDAWQVSKQLHLIDGQKPQVETEKLATQYIQDKLSITDFKTAVPEQDITFVKITELLGKEEFSFTPIQLKFNHKYIFEGVYAFAGNYREVNISKSEPILNGESVQYASYQMIADTLQYDFDTIKAKEKTLENLVYFVADIWQVHPFLDGNTRTNTVFLIQALRHFGYDGLTFEDITYEIRDALVLHAIGNQAELKKLITGWEDKLARL